MKDSQFYVGWGSLALINAGIAQSRRRSGLNWFLLSLFLGPVATFLLVSVFREPPHV
jgi:hypothetical protein